MHNVNIIDIKEQGIIAKLCLSGLSESRPVVQAIYEHI